MVLMWHQSCEGRAGMNHSTILAIVRGSNQRREMATPKRTCNRHTDCDAAVLKWKAEHPQSPYTPVDFHCHDDECEDCFGC